MSREPGMNVLRSAGVVMLAGVVSMLSGGRILAQNATSNADSAADPLPKDVYPDSRDRLPLPKRSDLDEYGKKIMDELPAEKQLPATVHSIRLYSPVARPMEEADRYLNYETGLPDRLVEIAILITAR